MEKNKPDGSSKTWKVLLVDDEPDFLNIAKNIMERLDKNIEFETANSAEKGIQLIKNKEFDAIVSDYKMPWMKGTEFLKKGRKIRDDIPFIMLTGRGNKEVAIEAANLGVDRYMEKEGKAKDLFEDLANEIIQAIKEKKKPKTGKLIAWIEMKTIGDVSAIKYDFKHLARKIGFKIEKLELHDSPFNPESGKIVKAYTKSFEKIPKNKSEIAKEWREKVIWSRSTIDVDVIIEEKTLTKKTQFLKNCEKTKWKKFSIKELTI